MNSYTFHINLYHLAFVGVIFIGLNFAVLLWFTKTVNCTANRFLALALATMILWMVWVPCIDLGLETYLPLLPVACKQNKARLPLSVASRIERGTRAATDFVVKPRLWRVFNVLK